ncbi:uncharacterized protein LOC120260481 isoform X1 [Dioscorea cayenensis subsp. rotundata]|uniref:Uncharacterized protein LOC120260481 isoform X1 n=1 Tax=Dioscorea cayennensis subsp. rotundata TaxID=55577 RepID=A0AB40BAY7_DIOCR|nr:uncharacterized protein LOC120260481 isoform X1 [Dioscorea cayenensis subsp. rotundata]
MSRARHDLELRLGLSSLWKGGAPASNSVRRSPEFILIDDDDDDDDDDEVQIYHSGPNLETRNFFPHSGSWMHVLTEADLGLRLGIGAPVEYSGNSSGRNMPRERSEDPYAWKCGKASASRIISDFSEVKLKCVICMEAMKEETSTMCGHIFCRVCITNAIRAQKKCPTCREKLTISSIHRIYLPGATS